MVAFRGAAKSPLGRGARGCDDGLRGDSIVTQTFIDHLARFAATRGHPGLTPVIHRLRRPVGVAVVGRDGVGRRTAATALRRAGVEVVSRDAGEVGAVVIAEDAKREDVDLARALGRPVVLLLTKADLAGSGPGGPLAVARRRAAAITARSGLPTVPMVGLLAALGPSGLDDAVIGALRALAADPPNMTGVDALVDDPHPVGREVRSRLLGLLDRFGLAHAILALERGVAPDALTAHLAGLSNVEEALAALDAAAARVRYRRVVDAVAELRCLADGPVDEWLASDEVVLAVMTAAVDVVEADGGSVDRGDTPAAHLARAVHWRRYGRGPVSLLHQRCGADITRGSLRLLGGRSG